MASVGRLAFGWFLTGVIVMGPYLALRFGLPWLVENYIDIGRLDTSDAVRRFILALNVHYWWVMALYIVLAGLITPSYDRENLGLWGTFIDNPFSYQDDFNRSMFTLATLLAPGKVVWVTARVTFEEIRDRLSWRGVD